MYPVRISCVRRGADDPTPLADSSREGLAADVVDLARSCGLPVEHVVLTEPQPDGLDVVVFVMARDARQARSVALDAVTLATTATRCLARWRVVLPEP